MDQVTLFLDVKLFRFENLYEEHFQELVHFVLGFNLEVFYFVVVSIAQKSQASSTTLFLLAIRFLSFYGLHLQSPVHGKVTLRVDNINHFLLRPFYLFEAIVQI